MLQMRITMIADDVNRKPKQEEALTQVVNAHGGLLKLKMEVQVGQLMRLVNPKKKMKQNCGVLRGAKSDLDGALADLGKSIELNPRNGRAHANRGMIMLLRRQDIEAQKEFDAALKIDSSLRTDLEKSIDQIIKARQAPPATRRP